MQRRAWLAALTAALAGCAIEAQPPRAPALLLRLAPAALGRRLALAQQLRVWAGTHEFQFEALLEADERSLRLAVFAFGQVVARLQWDGTSLVQQMTPGWPAAVAGEQVLSGLVLVLWPAEAVAASLPPEWSLHADREGRELRWRGVAVQRVRIESPQRVQLEHLTLGYRMQIDSQELPPPA